jgi:hypothetical protein
MLVQPRTTRITGFMSYFLLLSYLSVAHAHEHHPEDIPEGQATSNDPIVSYRRADAA